MGNELTMNITTYSTENELIEDVALKIENIIRQCIHEHNDSHILLSGGSTPGPIYEKLSEKEINWNNVLVGLADERFVRTTSAFSNEQLLKKTLITNKAEGAQLIGMVFNPMNREDNLKITKSKYTPFRERTDFLLLGMGTDGHTASLFPFDPCSEEDLNRNNKEIISTTAPSDPKERISCSKGLLLQSKKIFLVIKGKEKLSVLENKAVQLPIHNFLNERNDIEIYYCES